MTTVLLADDDRDIRDLVAFKLAQEGFEVVATENGVAALAAMRTRRPDLVLLDVMMPGMTGIDVCREVRRDPGLTDVPIILLTAKAQESDVQQGFGAGADDYVVKPFSPRELVVRCRAVLGRGHR